MIPTRLIILAIAAYGGLALAGIDIMQVVSVLVFG